MSNYQGYIVEESIFQQKKIVTIVRYFTKTYRRKGNLEWLWWDDLWGKGWYDIGRFHERNYVS